MSDPAVPSAPVAPAPAPAASAPLYTTAQEAYGLDQDRGTPTPGLSAAPGLRPVADSPVPGTDRFHVIGPTQAAVDPVLAGLDTGFNPPSRAEDRVITRTDGVNVVPPSDDASAALPGPTGTSAPGAPENAALAARVTPSALPVVPRPVASEAAANQAPVIPVEPGPALLTED